MKKILSKIKAVLLFIPTEAAGTWVMHDLRRWARGFQMEAPVGKRDTMKPQTKIDILTMAETMLIITGTFVASVTYIGSPLAILPILSAIAASLILGLYIQKRVLKLTWKETWARFKTN